MSDPPRRATKFPTGSLRNANAAAAEEQRTATTDAARIAAAATILAAQIDAAAKKQVAQIDARARIISTCIRTGAAIIIALISGLLLTFGPAPTTASITNRKGADSQQQSRPRIAQRPPRRRP